MEEAQPILRNTYEYKGLVDVDFYEVLTKGDIPDYKWDQVYVVGDLDGLVPLVIHRDSSQANLPGGGVEDGEDIESAARREVKEELNMELGSWEPLGYQICTRRQTGEVSYQFRIYAKLRKNEEFIYDPDGSVIGHILVGLDQANQHIDYGGIGEYLIERVKKFF